MMSNQFYKVFNRCKQLYAVVYVNKNTLLHTKTTIIRIDNCFLLPSYVYFINK